MKLRKSRLDNWWLNKLTNLTEKHYPYTIGYGELVDHWKVDGYNDGTTTLYGVYKIGDIYRRVVFPDYSDPRSEIVKPVYEHVGWSSGD